MRKSKIVEHQPELVVELERFYEGVMTEGHNYNRNRTGWCCELILQTVAQAEQSDSFVVSLLDTSCVSSEFDRIEKIRELIPSVRTKVEARSIVNILRCSCVHLCFAGLTRYEVHHGPQFQGRFDETPLFELLPDVYKYFHRANSLAYIEKSEEDIYVQTWSYYRRNNLKSKSWTNSLQVVRDLILDEAILDFQDITEDRLTSYQASYPGSRTATSIVRLLADISGNDFSGYKSPTRTASHSSRKATEVDDLKVTNEYNGYLENIDDYKNVTVYKKKSEKIVSTECWTFDATQILNEVIDMSSDQKYKCWNDAIYDFKNSVSEKSSRKNIESKIKYLAG